MKRKILILFLVILMSAGIGISIYKSVINPPAQEVQVVEEGKSEDINLLQDFWDRSWLSLILLAGAFAGLGIYRYKESREIKGEEE